MDPIFWDLEDDSAAGTGLALRSGMPNAAQATLSEADAQPMGEGGFSAFLRLRQGSSARATWVLEESPGGTMISVGADDACDWQLRAAFVPARAFSILVVGGRTFVRSGPEPGVLLNGKPLDDGWVQIHNGGRIDVGLARLEVNMGYGLQPGATAAQASVQAPQPHIAPKSAPRKFAPKATLGYGPYDPSQSQSQVPQSQSPQSQLVDHVDGTYQPAETIHELRNPKKAPQGRQADPSAFTARTTAAASPRPRNTTIELSLEDLDYMGTRASSLPHMPDPRREISGEFAVGDVGYGPDGAPSLLGGTSRKDKPKLWRYALVGACTVGAYGGWVFLLDYL